MVLTLKNAWYAGWRIRVRCFAFGPNHKAGHRDHVLCDHTTELDVKTLVWTRGPAFGYRFDYAGRSVVLSGDTRYCENLVRHAMGVDLLIHEVAMTRPQLIDVDRIRRVIGHHSTPQDAAHVFRQTMPRLAVFHHLVLIGDDSCAPPSVQELIDATRKEYGGTFVVGEDLMSFHVCQEIATSTSPGL
jgi:ribonuclease Z